MIVVNLFGAPGAGKSTGAAYIFSKLKAQGVNAELVTEFAKDKVWEDNQEVFKNQAYIFGKQSFKMSRCKDKVDVIVTDSPLLLSALYNEDPVLGEDFDRTVLNVFNSYDNLSFFIERDKPYNPSGRRQTEAESNKIANDLSKMLDKYGIDVTVDSGNETGYQNITNTVLLAIRSKRLPRSVQFINKKVGEGRMGDIIRLAAETGGIILCEDIQSCATIANTVEHLSSSDTIPVESRSAYSTIKIMDYGLYIVTKEKFPDTFKDVPVLIYNPEKIIKDFLYDAPIIAMSSQLPADSTEV